MQICDGVQAGLNNVAGREGAEDGPLGYVDSRRVSRENKEFTLRGKN